MEEIRCPHCGAVFIAGPTNVRCPHCSYDLHTPLARARLFVREYGWIAVPSGFVLIWRGLSVESLILAVLTIAMGIGYHLFVQRSERSSLVYSGALNPRAKDALIKAAQSSNSGPSAPQVPDRWKSLVGIPLPRDIYYDARTILGIIFEFAFIAGGTAWGAWMLRESDIFRNRHFFLSGPDLILLIWVGGWVSAAYQGISAEWRARNLLRDGEVSIGMTIDVRGRRAKTLEYQFWTRTGERFEHSGQIVSGEKEEIEKGLFPVFYDPSDPTKSIGLYCTRLRVRVPGEAFVSRRKRSSIRS